MATVVEVRHPDPLIRDLALEYIAGVEWAIAAKFAEYTNKVSTHGGQIYDRDQTQFDKKRLTTLKNKP